MTTAEALHVTLLDLHPSTGDIRGEVIAGLSKQQKTLPPKLFYDAAGSQLFDRITELPEYYPTQTEIGIMRRHIGEMTKLIGPQASLIELGSGSSTKIKILLDNLIDVAAYVPVEISKEHLMDAAERIAEGYPDLDVRPVCADFTKPFRLPRPTTTPLRNVVYFPGSTIGNFYPSEALALLDIMARAACRGGGVLIGVDLKKDKAILERAYNDSAGVTAQFNLNMLNRLNIDLNGDFDIAQFAHRAIYNEQMGRIEMHLVSNKAQQVRVAGQTFDFAKDEYILSECSHKYSIEDFIELAAKADLRSKQVWLDDNNMFSVHYLECAADFASAAIS